MFWLLMAQNCGLKVSFIKAFERCNWLHSRQLQIPAAHGWLFITGPPFPPLRAWRYFTDLLEYSCRTFIA
jgi:hypothetical protein